MHSLEQVLPRFALSLAQPAADGTRKARTDVTIANYLSSIRRLDREVRGLLDAPAAVEARLKEWRAELQQRLRAGTVSASKIACDVSALRCLYKELNGLGLYTGNPAAAIPSMNRDRKLPTPMPPADVRRLFAVPDLSTPDGRRDRALLELYLHALRNTEAGLLTIDRVLFLGEGESPTLGVKPFGKGRKERMMPLHVHSARIVGRYLLDRFGGTDWGTWPITTPKDPNDLVFSYVEWLLTRVVVGSKESVFLTDTGAPCKKRWSNRHFRLLCDQAGIVAKWTPHSLRHRFGASLLDSGEDIRVIQELMGHADIRTTQLYTHVAGAKRRAAAQQLDTPAASEVFAWMP